MSHLTIKDRLRIEHLLREGRNFQEIADCLKKARSTIVREVRKHREKSSKAGYNRIPNYCIHRRECNRKHVCFRERCYRRCSTCPLCNEYCTHFQEEHCPKLKEPPYVCNGCREENRCTLNKQFYIHDVADHILVLTEMDVDGRKIVIPVEVSQDISTERGDIDAHIVLTMYDTDDWVKQYFNPAVEAENRGEVGVFFIDNEKAALHPTISLPLSGRNGTTSNGFYHTIHDEGAPVKGKFTKSTETRQFKRWFGKSVMVDENGNPLVMYKGITSSTTPPYDGNTYPSHPFPTFRHDGKDWINLSSFWTYDRSFAKNWAKGLGVGEGRVVEAYLKIENPYIIDAKGAYAGNIQFHEGNEEFMRAIEDPQYDGVIIRNTADEGDIVVVKDSTQIKSVDNIGTFDFDNPDVRYQSEQAGHRGAITPLNEAWQATIGLFEGAADASTLVHETSHYVFDIMARLVESGMADERLKSDYETLKNWATLSDEAAQKGYAAYLKLKIYQLPEINSEKVL